MKRDKKINLFLHCASGFLCGILGACFLYVSLFGFNANENENEHDLQLVHATQATVFAPSDNNVENIDSITNDHFVDMSQVVSIESNNTSAYLTMSDGTGYYWEIDGYDNSNSGRK